MDNLSQLDLELRRNFFFNDDVEYEGDFASGYSFLKEGRIFEGRAADLAASMCEGAVAKLGYRPADVFLGWGTDRSNRLAYACLVRDGFIVMELARLSHGAYVNAYGLPYTKPRDVLLSDVNYQEVYSFGRQEWIKSASKDWPIVQSWWPMPDVNKHVEEFIENHDAIVEQERLDDDAMDMRKRVVAAHERQLENFGTRRNIISFIKGSPIFTIVTALGVIALMGIFLYMR